jgi:hypothetical protein
MAKSGGNAGQAEAAIYRQVRQECHGSATEYPCAAAEPRPLSNQAKRLFWLLKWDEA